MTKKLVAALGAALAMSAVSAATGPAAHADVCGDAHGRHVAVGGCTDVAGHVADGVAVAGGVAAGAAVAHAADPFYFGEQPCFAPDGAPYFTPPGAPC